MWMLVFPSPAEAKPITISANYLCKTPESAKEFALNTATVSVNCILLAQKIRLLGHEVADVEVDGDMFKVTVKVTAEEATTQAFGFVVLRVTLEQFENINSMLRGKDA